MNPIIADILIIEGFFATPATSTWMQALQAAMDAAQNVLKLFLGQAGAKAQTPAMGAACPTPAVASTADPMVDLKAFRASLQAGATAIDWGSLLAVLAAIIKKILGL